MNVRAATSRRTYREASRRVFRPNFQASFAEGGRGRKQAAEEAMPAGKPKGGSPQGRAVRLLCTSPTRSPIPASGRRKPTAIAPASCARATAAWYRSELQRLRYCRLLRP